MNPRTAVVSRTQKSNGCQREGPNWVLIAGGALLSTLPFRLGFKLKQAIDTKQPDDSGNGKSTGRRKQPASCLHSNMYSYMQGNDGCFNCFPGGCKMSSLSVQQNQKRRAIDGLMSDVAYTIAGASLVTSRQSSNMHTGTYIFNKFKYITNLL